MHDVNLIVLSCKMILKYWMLIAHIPISCYFIILMCQQLLLFCFPSWTQKNGRDNIYCDFPVTRNWISFYLWCKHLLYQYVETENYSCCTDYKAGIAESVELLVNGDVCKNRPFGICIEYGLWFLSFICFTISNSLLGVNPLINLLSPPWSLSFTPLFSPLISKLFHTVSPSLSCVNLTNTTIVEATTVSVPTKNRATRNQILINLSIVYSHLLQGW